MKTIMVPDLQKDITRILRLARLRMDAMTRLLAPHLDKTATRQNNIIKKNIEESLSMALRESKASAEHPFVLAPARKMLALMDNAENLLHVLHETLETFGYGDISQGLAREITIDVEMMGKMLDSFIKHMKGVSDKTACAYKKGRLI